MSAKKKKINNHLSGEWGITPIYLSTPSTRLALLTLIFRVANQELKHTGIHHELIFWQAWYLQEAA